MDEAQLIESSRALNADRLCAFIEARAAEIAFDDRDEANRMVAVIDRYRKTLAVWDVIRLRAEAMRFDTHRDFLAEWSA